MNVKNLRRNLATAVVLTTLVLFPATAAEITGNITRVDADAGVEIQLPEGAIVALGDSVKIWTEIPGVGPAAISTPWTIDRVEGATVFATPNSPPAAMPKAGFTARIETKAVANVTPPPEGSSLIVPVQPEAMGFYDQGLEALARGDDVLAAEAFAHAADMDHPDAMSELGALYSFGRGVERDERGAIGWQKKAADLGSGTAMLRLGLIYLAGQGTEPDEAQSARWLTQAASEYGNAQAMYLLAMFYEDGIGVTSSMIEMVRWLEAAAEEGHLEAMFILGHIYLEGEDGIIAKDVRKTENHWLMAARSGHVGAMRMLSEFYEGEDLDAARHWTNAANAAPPPPAYGENPFCLSNWECYGQDETYSSAPPPQEPVQEDLYRFTSDVQNCDRFAASPRDPDRPNGALAVEYADLDAGRVIAECSRDIAQWPQTARFYAQIARGYHKAGQLEDAFNASMRGAELGSGQAMALVGVMYKAGMHVRTDAREAIKWFEKGGFAGNVTAMHFAAGMHLNAEGVPYDPVAAAEWYQAAADLGDGEAMVELGVLYDNGQGVSFDPNASAANLMAGLAMGSDKAQKVLMTDYHTLSPHTRIEVQGILRNDGLYHGVLDGVFGPKTLNALRSRIMNE